MSASPPFFTHRKLRWWQSTEEGRDGGGNVCLWEHVPFHLGQPLHQTNSANPSERRQDPGKIPDSLCFPAAHGEGTIAVSHLLIPRRVFFPFASSQSLGITSPVGKDGDRTLGRRAVSPACSPTAWGGGEEDPSSSSQHRSVYTPQGSGAASRRGRDS